LAVLWPVVTNAACAALSPLSPVKNMLLAIVIRPFRGQPPGVAARLTYEITAAAWEI
jgi:hypothetical protein